MAFGPDTHMGAHGTLVESLSPVGPLRSVRQRHTAFHWIKRNKKNKHRRKRSSGAACTGIVDG